MISEEPLEDRKLSTVKSWFTRSASCKSFQNGSLEDAAEGNSSSVSVSKEGVLESGPGLARLRQLSMRRSRPSGEIEKELGAGSPSMTARNITPLTPLTPLRWKSNARELEEEEKAMERSRLGTAGSVGMPRDEKEDPRGKLAAQGQHQGEAAHDRTQSVDELSTKTQAGNIDDIVSLDPTEGLDRKLSLGDDVMTMTIEFLRARLLSERSTSKAAKQRVQQLATKVSELEEKLNQAIAERKKAEVAAQEAFLKLKLTESSNQVLDRASGEVSDRSLTNSTKLSPPSRSRAGREDTKYVQQEMGSNEDLSRTNSYGSSVEDRDSTTKKQLPESVSKVEGPGSAEQGRPGTRPTLQNMTERSQESPQKQDSRAAVEIRLRNMWSKISEEMAALAEERSEEDLVREELMSWMGQVPSVLQDVIPKKPVSPTHNVPLSSETESTQPKLVETRPEQSPSVQDKGPPHASAKRAALLHDQFATQENIQQEWERNYYESQRQLEQFKGDDHNANRSPRASTVHREHQHADHMRGLNSVADDPSFFGSPHARLAKSKSALDLPMRPSEYNSDMSSPHRDGLYVESDSWNRERPREQGTDGRHRDPVYQNTPAQKPIPLEPNHLNHSRMHQERSGAPSMLQEAGHEAWPERQLDQEPGLYYYQDTGNRAGHPSSYAERGPFDSRSQWPPTNRSAEDGLRRSQSDFRAGQQLTWDDGDHRNSGRHHQAQQPGDSEREESYSYSHPESTHRRPHSDNEEWPAVEDYGVLGQQPEPSPGLVRRQSYSGYPAATTSDSSRTGFDKPPGSYNDLRYSDERMYGARGLRRESFPSSKASHAFGPQYSTQAGRNGVSNAEPTLSLGYGPAFDAPPREGSPVQRSPKAGLNRNISDVLRALQMAKANIQNGGAGAKEQRLSGEPTGQYVQQPPRQTMLDQFRHSESQAPLSNPSRPAKYDPYEAEFGSDRYQSEGDAPGGTNANNTSYVDELNVGKGIQFFFP